MKLIRLLKCLLGLHEWGHGSYTVGRREGVYRVCLHCRHSVVTDETDDYEDY